MIQGLMERLKLSPEQMQDIQISRGVKRSGIAGMLGFK
jgi:hypothetical protein